MALSQLRPFVIEGDRPAAAQPASEFTRLPDGSLVMRGQKPVEAKPGVLAGLRSFIASKLNPAPPVDRYWIPPEQTPAAPVAAAPAPVVAGPGMPLPAYNDPWGEIEAKAAEQERVAKELGAVSKNILGNERLIQGKWFSTNAPKRVD